MTYHCYEFFTRNEVERDWLISILSDFHFEGFEETSDSLKGFVYTDKMTNDKVAEILADNEFAHIEFSSSAIENKNWNEEWEKNFEPVLIANRVAIRAPFHGTQNAEFEIIIEPKMSFGTGHHATTAGVIELMLAENFENKTVLDFGSGTGVLGILAEKLKAQSVFAIDNEEWAYYNCIENVQRNSCKLIKTVQGDAQYAFTEKFDVILANINRNVILSNICKWKSLLNEKGILLVSGILLNDETDVVTEAEKNKLSLKSIIRNNGWVAISFQLL
jgi:ribosomal protein L11 methyltransferase